MQMSPQDEGVGEEPECVVYCHSWQRHAPAPETPSRQETGKAWDPMPASPHSVLRLVRATGGLRLVAACHLLTKVKYILQELHYATSISIRLHIVPLQDNLQIWNYGLVLACA